MYITHNISYTNYLHVYIRYASLSRSKLAKKIGFPKYPSLTTHAGTEHRRADPVACPPSLHGTAGGLAKQEVRAWDQRSLKFQQVSLVSWQNKNNMWMNIGYTKSIKIMHMMNDIRTIGLQDLHPSTAWRVACKSRHFICCYKHPSLAGALFFRMFTRSRR